MKTWPAILLTISVFTIIIAASEFKNFKGGILGLALIGLVVALLMEAFHLMSGKKW